MTLTRHRSQGIPPEMRAAVSSLHRLLRRQMVLQALLWLWLLLLLLLLLLLRGGCVVLLAAAEPGTGEPSLAVLGPQHRCNRHNSRLHGFVLRLCEPRSLLARDLP